MATTCARSTPWRARHCPRRPRSWPSRGPAWRPARRCGSARRSARSAATRRPGAPGRRPRLARGAPRRPARVGRRCRRRRPGSAASHRGDRARCATELICRPNSSRPCRRRRNSSGISEPWSLRSARTGSGPPAHLARDHAAAGAKFDRLPLRRDGDIEFDQVLARGGRGVDRDPLSGRDATGDGVQGPRQHPATDLLRLREPGQDLRDPPHRASNRRSSRGRSCRRPAARPAPAGVPARPCRGARSAVRRSAPGGARHVRRRS